jgi:hypothetical protein
MEEAMPLQLLANLGWHECSVLLFALLLALVFFLVLRQNPDYLELVGILTSSKAARGRLKRRMSAPPRHDPATLCRTGLPR